MSLRESFTYLRREERQKQRCPSINDVGLNTYYNRVDGSVLDAERLHLEALAEVSRLVHGPHSCSLVCVDALAQLLSEKNRTPDLKFVLDIYKEMEGAGRSSEIEHSLMVLVGRSFMGWTH